MKHVLTAATLLALTACGAPKPGPCDAPAMHKASCDDRGEAISKPVRPKPRPTVEEPTTDPMPDKPKRPKPRPDNGKGNGGGDGVPGNSPHGDGDR